MSLVSLCKTLLKVQGMALVLTTSGLLLGGCGGGSQSSGSTDTPVQTDGGTTDGSGDVHTAMLALQRAEVSMQVTVQVRNKLVQAYQDLMRMPI
mgnify:CR=1 FL=1